MPLQRRLLSAHWPRACLIKLLICYRIGRIMRVSVPARGLTAIYGYIWPLSSFVLSTNHYQLNTLQTNNTTAKLQRRVHQEVQKFNMHGSDCPSCGAAGQSDKTCGSCGAVSGGFFLIRTFRETEANNGYSHAPTKSLEKSFSLRITEMRCMMDEYIGGCFP